MGTLWSSVFPCGSRNQPIRPSSAPKTNLLNSFGTIWKFVFPSETKNQDQETSPSSEEEESSVIPQLYLPPKSTKENIPPSSKPTSTTLWKSLKAFVNSVIPSETTKETIPPISTPPSSNVFESIGKFWSSLTPKMQDRSSSSADDKSPIVEEGDMERSESDSHTTQQPIPSPTSENLSPSDRPEKTNSTEEEGSGSTLLDSDFNALLETKLSELLESTQTSIVEKQEEQEKEEVQKAVEDLQRQPSETYTTTQPLPSSTEPSETTTPIPNPTSGYLSLSDRPQNTIVEEKEEHKTEEKHEASSTEPSETTTPIRTAHTPGSDVPFFDVPSEYGPIRTTTSTPQNDSIHDVSETCDGDSICYVAPKDCTTNCDVIFAVSEEFENSTVYVRQGGVSRASSSVVIVGWDMKMVKSAMIDPLVTSAMEVLLKAILIGDKSQSTKTGGLSNVHFTIVQFSLLARTGYSSIASIYTVAPIMDHSMTCSSEVKNE
ncbi:hypothetical protein L3Y34_013489 [Caenorhabditis briggsae]|uniref:Uncharacterized protein n=1 Tax=Caenorhabditis briggsae TaxID=6238 RepID=A0AAE8ZU59_CAEBR|nr:hypothetical protein L3Y34_013489 [Caenorhabditis briggsae]